MPANQGRLLWTDALGGATLGNSRPGIAARFRRWHPLPGVKDSEAEALTGVAYGFPFAQLHDAGFELPFLAHADHPLAARFVRHAMNKGHFTVDTGDAALRAYADCQCVVGSPPTLEMTDRKLRWWTLTLPRVRNVAAAPAEMLCLYP